MNPMEELPNETFSIPSSAAEAWAAVYMDVAEKLDAETLASSQTETTPKEEPMVTEYITCDAPMDFPVPTIDMLVERIHQMYDGKTPVSTKALAASYKLAEGAIAANLRHAAEMRAVQEIQAVGWIPLKT
jgi:hypothetical protein